MADIFHLKTIKLQQSKQDHEKNIIGNSPGLHKPFGSGCSRTAVYPHRYRQYGPDSASGPNGRLYQSYFGEKLLHENDVENLLWDIHAGSDGSVSQRGWEVYGGSGNEDYFEPAIAVTHSDGNPSTYLYYVSSSTQQVEGGTQTTINLRDDKYPVDVTLHYVAYPKENVIKTWSEIKHQEKKPVYLSRYASTMLYFNRTAYYLTEFSGDWAKEMQMSTQQLQPGKKILDTKLGSRAAMHMQPFFEVGLDQPADEQKGDVLMGTLGWTGNFRFTFEVDNAGNLRIIPAINPYASRYELKADEVFTTPEFIFTLSHEGIGCGKPQPPGLGKKLSAERRQRKPDDPAEQLGKYRIQLQSGNSCRTDERSKALGRGHVPA